jgi:hypothetical protein
MMDNAPSTNGGTPLAIGSVTINPANPGTVFVGTGEGNLSGDSFFGSGFYIITNADSANPTVNGPYNANARRRRRLHRSLHRGNRGRSDKSEQHLRLDLLRYRRYSLVGFFDSPGARPLSHHKRFGWH